MMAISLFKPLATLWLMSIIENTGIVNEHLSLYQNKYRPKGGKQIHCLSAVPRGDKPTGIDASSKWFTNINNASDLRSKNITRSTTLNFNSSSITETKELAKVEGSATRN
jgi:hypothetical protein